MIHLITGHLDEPHVTADNEGAVNIEIFGSGKFAFEKGRDFESSVESNNLVRIYDGLGLFDGRAFELESGDYEDLTIENGTQGQKRIDLIVFRYSKDAETLVETISLEVIKGTASETPVQPSYNEGNISEGDTLVDFPIYAVNINGIEIESVEQLFDIKDGIGESLGEITPEEIDELWGSSLENGDEIEY